MAYALIRLQTPSCDRRQDVSRIQCPIIGNSTCHLQSCGPLFGSPCCAKLNADPQYRRRKFAGCLYIRGSQSRVSAPLGMCQTQIQRTWDSFPLNQKIRFEFWSATVYDGCVSDQLQDWRRVSGQNNVGQTLVWRSLRNSIKMLRISITFDALHSWRFVDVSRSTFVFITPFPANEFEDSDYRKNCGTVTAFFRTPGRKI